jgi:hypothetical protein
VSSWDFPAEVNIEDLYQSFNQTGLYNPKIQQDLWLNVTYPSFYNVFVSPNTNFYQRYIALNFGLGGFFAPLTPRQVIEGYTDSMLEMVKSTPVYMGGDMAIDSWISADKSAATNPNDIPVVFNTGESDYTLTRQITAWFSDHVQIAHEFFETTNSVYSRYYNPWYPYTIPITPATDGW